MKRPIHLIRLSLYISLLILTGTCDLIPDFTPNREWYLPFQKFRYKLVKLIDILLDILKSQEFYFTFDGQTIVLEDYLEIRPEKKQELMQYIREGKIRVGPWYLLPDIWLVGQESLIRNLEYSFDLANKFNIPLMPIGYLPDMFGHSRVIPQLIGDITDFKVVIVWRGMPPEITTVPFRWRSDKSAVTSVLALYLPFGYGNASALPVEPGKLANEINDLVKQLQPFSPLPVFLLLNGTDHRFPNPKMTANLSKVKIENANISLAVLDDYVIKFQELIKSQQYSPPEYSGELRSAARAHLLQDTYSARTWIKQWNQKIEDLLVNYAEPLNTYDWYYLNNPYPTSFLIQAWKWHLRNQPHDSICGCSIDQTHDEMRFRYSWAESLSEMTIENALSDLSETPQASNGHSCLVFNPTNCRMPLYFEARVRGDLFVQSVEINGQSYEVQSLQSAADIIWEMTLGELRLKTLMRMLPGRQFMNYYINKTSLLDGIDPETCEIRLIVGDKPVGEIDMGSLKKELSKVIDAKKYQKFHILATKEHEQTYIALAPLPPWSLTKVNFSESLPKASTPRTLTASKDRVGNDFYELTFNKEGTFDILDKENGMKYTELHSFEDWGDQGDEYTFGRTGPEFVKVNKVKRTLSISGPLVCEIKQIIELELFREIDESTLNRIGEVKMPVTTIFRFYRDSPRIDLKTELTNISKDHRLRICFDLPFESTHTLTSTHFGCIERPSDPVGDDTYIEKPSGIQPQKRYIRIENPENQVAITLMNKGLPEVELVNGNRLALTLIRSIGWLSRSGIPERPEHAGPRIATPGAQEYNTPYTFEYGLLVHSKDNPLWQTEDYAEAFCLQPITTKGSSNDVLPPLIQVLDPDIRISSLRVREEKIWVTLFNLQNRLISTKVRFTLGITRFFLIKIDGSVKEEKEVIDDSIELSFEPFEIMIGTF